MFFCGSPTYKALGAITLPAAEFAIIEFRALKNTPVCLSGILVDLWDNTEDPQTIGDSIDTYRPFVAGDSDGSGPPEGVPFRRRLNSDCTAGLA
jgi:hypothetical protein